MSSPVSGALADRAAALTGAYLLPGLVALAGAASVNPTVAAWFGSASTSPSLVGFLFVVAAALAVGVVLNALRWWVFERASLARRGPMVPAPAQIDERRRADFQAQYDDLRRSHYDHYLAFANMAVAVPLAVLTWSLWGGPHPSWGVAQWAGIWIACGVVSLVCARAGCEAVTRYERKRLQLIGPVPRDDVA